MNLTGKKIKSKEQTFLSASPRGAKHPFNPHLQRGSEAPLDEVLRQFHQGGSPPTLISHPQLNTWLKGNDQSLSAYMLVPLGLLKKVYQSYGQLEQPPRLVEMVEENDVRQYMRHQGITHINAQTQLPYAIVMGPSVFHQVVMEMVHQGGRSPP
jgi:acyl CoA:acetate/3-ketoacid CoA transferase